MTNPFDEEVAILTASAAFAPSGKDDENPSCRYSFVAPIYLDDYSTDSGYIMMSSCPALVIHFEQYFEEWGQGCVDYRIWYDNDLEVWCIFIHQWWAVWCLITEIDKQEKKDALSEDYYYIVNGVFVPYNSDYVATDLEIFEERGQLLGLSLEADL